jgi:peptidoglycan/LPS O-acetylase OafA/YrhL
MRSSSESPNLDLLRSAAVTFVVVFHVLLFFQRTVIGPFNIHSIGHFGVLLFFVHTSLVLMFSLERHQQNQVQGSIFASFYVRRCFRILPLSLLVVLAVYCFELPVGHLKAGVFHEVHLNSLGLLSNLLLIQNVTHFDSIIAPLWSLPYEMQMYLVLPFLFLLVRAKRNALTVGAIWIASVLAASVSLYIRWFQLTDLLTYGPCFIAGVVAYWLTKERTRTWPFITLPAALVVLTTFFLRVPNITRGWISCLLVAVVLPHVREMRALWLRKACHQIARYSYGIYLTHFACIWLAFAALGAEPRAVQWAVFLTTLVVLPVSLYHAVEAPMIGAGSRLAASMGRSGWALSALRELRILTRPLLARGGASREMP